jgi:hypothetical protein
MILDRQTFRECDYSIEDLLPLDHGFGIACWSTLAY